jgi:hypothetical protein
MYISVATYYYLSRFCSSMREFSAGSEQLNALCTITPRIGNGKDHPRCACVAANALAAIGHVLVERAAFRQNPSRRHRRVSDDDSYRGGAC